jgi:hypothetical protein
LELDKTKTGNLLKQSSVFVEELRMTLKNQTPRIVKIQAMKKTEPSISVSEICRRPLLDVVSVKGNILNL